MTPWLLLKSIHVFAAVFWFGALVVVARYLLPAAAASGAEGRSVMRQVMQVRRLPAAVSGASGLALLTGLVLLWRRSAAIHASPVSSFFGVSLTIGSLAGAAAFALGTFVDAPRSRRLETIVSRLSGQPSPEQATEIARLRQLLARGAIRSAILLAIALLGMKLSHPI